MEAITKITCPNCGHHFNAEQALANEVETRLKKEFNAKFKQEIEKRDQANAQKFEEELRQREAKLKEKAIAEVALKLKNFEEGLVQKERENYSLKQREVELMNLARTLEEQKNAQALDMQKQLIESQKGIEEQAKKKAEDEAQLKLKEKDMLLDRAQRQMAEMQKQIEQGSMQVQGEVQELVMEETLKQLFPFDLISEVAKGVKGADLIHTVRNSSGQPCGTILYESKRTKNFSNEWIDKLKSDLRGQKADVAVIVTATMPKDMERFGQKEGIWICSFSDFKGVSAVLRESLIRIHTVKSVQENKGDKMHMLYEFLTGNEFKQHIEAIVEGFSSMKNSLSKERMLMEKSWAERDKQLDRVLLNMIGMYGSIKGIAGSAVAEVKLLEIEDTGESVIDKQYSQKK